MKKTFFIIVFLLSINCLAIAQLKCEVNECFELTSIAFRLAGAKEYVNNDIVSYTNDIDKYFGNYSQHRLISYINQLRQNSQIGYDAVSNAASILEIKKGNVCIKSGIELSKFINNDKRWSEYTFQCFVNLLNNFYKTSKFKHFFLKHADTYQVAIERMDILLKNINTYWFKSFFGEELKKMTVIVSLCNGPNNYAFLTNNTHCGIVIGSGSDNQGLPVYSIMSTYKIIHELSHGFTNKRVMNIWNQIDSASYKIYPYVKDQMYRNAYGSAQTVMTEWMNNLFSIMYFQENPLPGLSPCYITATYQDRGFIWLERSVTLMKHFYNNREKFKTIDDFMPQIIGFINFTASDFNKVLNEYDNRCPYVLDVFPASGSTIPTDTDTIEIHFSEAMSGSHGICPLDDEKVLSLPIAKMPSWRDEFTFIIPLNKSEFKNGKTYGFKLNSKSFLSVKQYKLVKDFTYTINTL